MSYKKQWSREQETDLFTLQSAHGNRWAFIASQLKNKKDVASIKNKFYSTLRKGHRKLNNYIKNIKKKEDPNKYRGLKLIQQIFIIKLVSVVDNSYDAKYEVKETAIKLANNIQQRLISIALDEHQYDKRQKQSYQNQQKLLQDILQFNKSCKKRKGKKKQQKKPLKKRQQNQNQNNQQQNQGELYQSEIIERSQEQHDNNVQQNLRIRINHEKCGDNQSQFKINLANQMNNWKLKQNDTIQFAKNLCFFTDAKNDEGNGEPLKKSLNYSQQFNADNWLQQSTMAAKKKAESFHVVVAPTPATFFNLPNFNNYSINAYITSSMNSNSEDRIFLGQALVSSSNLKQQMNENNSIIQGIEQSHILKIEQSLQTQKTLNKTTTNLNGEYSFIHSNIVYMQNKILQKDNQNSMDKQVNYVVQKNI